MASWNGFQIRVGTDPIVGLNHQSAFPALAIHNIQQRGIVFLNQARSSDPMAVMGNYWHTADTIGLTELDSRVWDNFIAKLTQAGITLSSENDELDWTFQPVL